MSNHSRSSHRRRQRRRHDAGTTHGWHELMTSMITSPVTGSSDRAIFTNRTLRFDRVKAVGFDLDHTLVVYNCQALDSLAMRLVIDRLIAHEGYAGDWFDEMPEPIFARKGLVIDTALGNVLKIDRYGHVRRVYHGTRRLATAEKRKLYGNIDVIPFVTQAERFLQSDTAFAHPEILIFAALAPRVGPARCPDLWRQIRHHTDTVHRDGSLKSIITADPLAYVRPDFDTVPMLRRLREGGKQVFLLTNSELDYTRQIVHAAMCSPGDDPDAWTELFDVIVVSSGKPGYFRPGSKSAKPVQLGDRTVLEGGNINDIEQRIHASGPEILYVGDHIFADLIQSKRSLHWRTMLVIPELEEELRVQTTLPGVHSQLHQSDVHRSQAERVVQHWNAIEQALRRIPTNGQGPLLDQLRADCAQNRKRALHALRQHIRQREDLHRRISKVTNKYWGMLFRAENELTYYGRQVEDFACTYTGRATNLGFYDPDHYFRSPMDYLPHELEPF